MPSCLAADNDQLPVPKTHVFLHGTFVPQMPIGFYCTNRKLSMFSAFEYDIIEKNQKETAQ